MKIDHLAHYINLSAMTNINVFSYRLPVSRGVPQSIEIIIFIQLLLFNFNFIALKQ